MKSLQYINSLYTDKFNRIESLNLVQTQLLSFENEQDYMQVIDIDKEIIIELSQLQIELDLLTLILEP